MKTVIMTLASVSLAVLLLMMVGLKPSSKANAQPPSPGSAVVVIRCYENDIQYATNFVVTMVSSSSNAPTTAIGTDCAQALAGLLSSGFEIANTMPDPLGGYAYTLTNQPEKHGKDK